MSVIAFRENFDALAGRSAESIIGIAHGGAEHRGNQGENR